jgi:dihydroxy-acid dehydratase
MTRDDTRLRSTRWFQTDDLAGLQHRAFLAAAGFAPSELDGRPVIGICNSWSELVNCNVHLRGLAAAVKRGVARAGGLPVEFNGMALGEQLMKPTAMLFRNLAAMEIEETIRANPLDAVVFLGGCDKTIPAQLMAAISVGVPAIMVPAGPRLGGTFRGKPVASGSDLWRYTDDRRAGRMSGHEFAQLEHALAASPGTCQELGTASTMAALAEALGMALLGSATAPAVTGARVSLAEESGERAVELALAHATPDLFVTEAALHNALTVLSAIGGATNALVHLAAIAGRLGIAFEGDRVNATLAAAPLVVNVKPLGAYLFEDLDRVGGVPAVMKELRPLLDETARTVSGGRLGEHLANAPDPDGDVLRQLGEPLASEPALGLVRGTLAPHGAALRPSAIEAGLRSHEGPAVVFDGLHDLVGRIETAAFDRDAVLVLRGVGPVGGPGMPEWGFIPIPERLLRAGVSDMLRISDARVSGTVAGSVIAHVAPEAAVGGPLAVVRSGDRIRFDLAQRRLDLLVEPDVVSRRLADLRRSPTPAPRGYVALYQRAVMQADAGCDFDFLRGGAGRRTDPVPPGLDTGWLSGW